MGPGLQQRRPRRPAATRGHLLVDDLGLETPTPRGPPRRRRPPSRRPRWAQRRGGGTAAARERPTETTAGQGRVRDRGPGKSVRALGGALQERGLRPQRDVILD